LRNGGLWNWYGNGNGESNTFRIVRERVSVRLGGFLVVRREFMEIEIFFFWGLVENGLGIFKVSGLEAFDRD
jgi:hypothetical protein